MSALRIVPVVDGIDPTCSCVCVNGRDIFTAQSGGKIRQYFIFSEKPSAIPTVDETAVFQVTGTVTRMVASGKVLFVGTSDATVFGIDTELKTVTKIASNIACFALKNDSAALMSVRGALSVWERVGKNYEKKMEVASEHVAVELVWIGDWIIGVSLRKLFAFKSANLSFEELFFPLDDKTVPPSLTVLPQSSQLLIIGQAGLGIFINITDEPPCPAMRNTIPNIASNSILRVISNYLVSCSAEGVLEIFSLSSEISKKIQTINLPSSAIFASGSSNDAGLPSIAGSVMYLLIPVPFETQFGKLMDQGKFDEAFELIQFHQQSQWVPIYHARVAWYHFKSLKFGIAFQHFHLCLTPTSIDDWTQLLAFWEQPLHALIGTENADLANLTEQASNGLSLFLLIQRKSNRIPAIFLPTTDLLILKYLVSAIDLIDFVLHSSPQVEKEQLPNLLARSPQALAAFYESSGQIDQAVSALVDFPLELLDLLNQHSADIAPHQLETELTRILTTDSSWYGEKRNTVIFLIGKASIDLVDRIADSAIRNTVLDALAESNEEAFIKQLKKKDEISQILKTQFASENVLKHLTNNWARSICLGKLHRHREALLEVSDHPELGLKYIEMFDESGELFLLYVTILFELDKAPEAFKVMSHHKFETVKFASRLIQVIPSDLAVTSDMCRLLKQLNAQLLTASAELTVEENLASWQFLKSHAEWANSRQTNFALITGESVCSACNQPIVAAASVAVMPSGALMHTSCFST